MLPDIGEDPPSSDEIRLSILVHRLWRTKTVGLILTVLFLVAAVIYLRNAEYRYTAKVILIPADQAGLRSTSDLASIGSLIGVNVSSQSGQPFALYSYAVQSYPVALQLSRDPRVMHSVFRGTWDPRLHQWREPASAVTAVTGAIKSALGLPRFGWHAPGVDDLKQFIEQRVTIIEDKHTQAVTLSFSDVDPAFAAYFLSRINLAADTYLREKALKRATIYVDYLERRLSVVQVAEYRMSMAQVLGNYEKTKMMASSSASYAAEPFGEVWVSPLPTSPKAAVVILVGLVGGLAAWALYALVVTPIFTALRLRRLAAAQLLG